MYKIILSLTAHENIECLCDLLDNIKLCFIHHDILVLLSITEKLCHKRLKSYNFVKIVTIRPNNLCIWGTTYLFHQHMLNMKYIQKKSIKYDYFWFVASNEMFIKIIPTYFLDKFALKLSDKNPQSDLNYDTYFKNFNEERQEWYWLELAKKDKHFMNYLYKNKFTVTGVQHEGMVLSSDIMLEIFKEYTENELYEKSTFRAYVMEEIFIPTFLLNKYILSNTIITFCFRYNYHPNLSDNSSYEKIEKNLHDHHVSIKPVKRDYNNPMRTYIRKIVS